MDTVKTIVLKAVETELKKLSTINSVHRRQPIAPDIEKAYTPALFFWETKETRKQNLKPLMVGEISLNVAVIFKITDGRDHGLIDWSDFADTISGDVRVALAYRKDLGAIYIEETDIKKAIAEAHGELLMTYRIVYGHLDRGAEYSPF
jgi:hypothetical protein